jgi:hypothetical protein
MWSDSSKVGASGCVSGVTAIVGDSDSGVTQVVIPPSVKTPDDVLAEYNGIYLPTHSIHKKLNNIKRMRLRCFEALLTPSQVYSKSSVLSWLSHFMVYVREALGYSLRTHPTYPLYVSEKERE